MYVTSCQDLSVIRFAHQRCVNDVAVRLEITTIIGQYFLGTVATAAGPEGVEHVPMVSIPGITAEVIRDRLAQ